MPLRITLFVTLVAAACGGSSSDAEQPAPVTSPAADDVKGDVAARERADEPKPEETSSSSAITAEESERIEQFMTGVIEAAKGGDCAASSKPATAQLDSNASWLAEVAARVGPEEAQAWGSDHGDLMSQFGEAMDTLADCARNDAELKAAMEQMPPPPR